MKIRDSRKIAPWNSHVGRSVNRPPIEFPGHDADDCKPMALEIERAAIHDARIAVEAPLPGVVAQQKTRRHRTDADPLNGTRRRDGEPEIHVGRRLTIRSNSSG
jgi:hypothetical protein